MLFPITSTHTSYTKQQGFTLIELLVALTIFAVLAAAGWQVFDQLQKTRERVGAQAERLSELQQAYMQVSRDLTQLVNRPVVTSSQQDASLTLSSQKVSFTKLAGIDPRFIQTTAFERVTYEVQDDKLVRLVQKNIGNDNEQPTPVVLLDKIDGLKFVALDPGPSNLWPSLNAVSQQNQSPSLTQLPVGVALAFSYTGMGPNTPIQWRFSIPEPAPFVSGPVSTSNNNNSSSNNGGNNTQGILGSINNGVNGSNNVNNNNDNNEPDR